MGCCHLIPITGLTDRWRVVARLRSRSGFTLVELMITLLLSAIIIGSIYTAFLSQLRSYTSQEQVAEMQQSLRAGTNQLLRELRMAGYDPSGTGLYGMDPALTDSETCSFTADLNEDGGTPGSGGGQAEVFLYELYDSDSDGVDDALRRTPSGSSVAENIEAIEFYYRLADGTKALNPTALQVTLIRGVEVSMLARASDPDRNYVNTRTYTTAAGVDWGPYNDNYRRRLLINNIICRNLGL